MSRIQELKRNLSLALQESSWDDALAVLEKLVSVEESQPAYHNQIGDILLKSGRQAEAIASFMRGITAYRELGMYSNGAALCKKVLRLEPEQRDAIWVLGELKTRQGFLTDGAEKMLEALRLYAEDSGTPRKALLELLDQAETLQPGSRAVLEFVSTTYTRLSEKERARRSTLLLADLEEREGRREVAERLRSSARELETPLAAAPPAPLVPAVPDDPPEAAAPAAFVPPPAAPPASLLEPSTRPLIPRARPEDIEQLMITRPEEPPAADPATDDEAGSDFEAFTVSRPAEPEAPAAAAPTAPTAEDLDAEAAELAASMLAQLQGDLPEVEVVTGRDAREELLTTRQLAESLSAQLHVETPVELIPEAPLAPPAHVAAPLEAAIPLTEAEPVLEAPPVAAAPPPAPLAAPVAPPVETPVLELASVQESLREAEGTWLAPPVAPRPASESAPPPEEPVGALRGERRRSIDLDAQRADGHLSFGLSTTAGEALQTDDIDEVLGEFKRRMKEQMGSMAPEERYQLGVSYMEMGLFEEALEEFEHTLEHKVLGQKTREWMARCLLELERPREIVLLLQTRLDAETYPRKSMVELYYVLGQAYEMLKAWDLALDAFTKVYQLDSEFRDVQARLAKLTGA